MSAKDFKLNPGVLVSSRSDFSQKSHTKRGDNFVGDFIGTSGFSGPVIASGGTLLNYTLSGVSYVSRTFTGSSTLTITRGGNIGYLVVAGGGYFGGDAGWQSGSPGAGGMLNSDNQAFGAYGKSIPKGAATYPVIVGGGGSPSHLGASTQSLYIHTTAGGNGGSGPGGHGGSGGGASSAYGQPNGPCHSGGSGIAGQGHGGGSGHCHNQCGYSPHGGGGGAGGSGGRGHAGSARSSAIYDGTSRNYAGGAASPGTGPPCYPGFGGGGGEYGYGNGGPGIVVVAHRS